MSGYPWSSGQVLTAADLNAAFQTLSSSPVKSFNGRIGGVTLTGADVTAALGYTPVQTVAGRTGTVTLTSSDLNDWTSAIAPLAPLNSPHLLGTPLAPTAAVNTNTTQIATTAFVTAAVPTITGANTVISTGSTTARALADRFANVANVLDFGADSTGAADSAAAIRAALATGRDVYLPKGTYHVASQITVGNGQVLYGDGRGLTTITVSGDFSTTDTGVISLTGREQAAPTVRDLAMQFAQPISTINTTTTAASAATSTTITVASVANIAVGNYVSDSTASAAIPALTTVTGISGNVVTLSAAIVSPGVGSGDTVAFSPSRANFLTLAGGGTSGTGGTGVKYPPAIIITTANRFKLSNLRISRAWDGIINAVGNGIGGFFIRDIEMSAFNTGLQLDNQFDFGHVHGYHFWNFDIQAPLSNVYYDGNTYAARFGVNGELDGLNVSDFTIWSGRVSVQNANSWIHINNMMMDGNGSTLEVSAVSWLQIGTVYFSGDSVAANGNSQIAISGGTTIINNLRAMATNRPTINVTGGSLQLTTGRIITSSTGVSAITQSGGTLRVNDVVFAPNTGAGAWTVPLINVTGSSSVIQFRNNMITTTAGDVGGLSIGTDNASNVVVGNAWGGWGWTPPSGGTGYYGLNQLGGTIGNASTAGSLLLAGPAASNRLLRFESGTSHRWAINVDATAESGGNAGSVFNLNRYDDSGNFLSAALTIPRSTGTVSFPQGATIASGSINNATVGASTPSTGAFTTLTATLAIVSSGYLSSKAATTVTGSSYTVASTDSAIIFNTSATHTLTLPAASTYSGRFLRLKTIAAFAINSASSNVVPLTSATAGTAILAATSGKWVTLHSDGTNWQIMAGN